jgi:uncharacterized membrane protein
MRSLFKLTFAAIILLNAVSFFLLPSRAAMHFGIGGHPDSWGSKHMVVTAFLLLEIPLFLLFLYSPKIILKSPPRFLNLPNKEYWLKKDNQSLLKEKMDSVMSEFGTVFFIFLFVVKLLTLEANRSYPDRLNERLFFIALILFLVFTVYWCVKLFRTFRIPENSSIS